MSKLYKECKKLIIFLLITCVVLTHTYIIGFAATKVSAYKRLSGNDRYKTAVAISQSGWKTSRFAVLARGDDYADALCAGTLAQKYGVPILLTETKELNTDTLTELKRLDVKNVFIVGGYGAISSNIEMSLTTEGIKYDRIYGIDRYETSVKIAEKLGAVNKIVLATGLDFPDALSISAIAANLGMPILLTEKESLPVKVKQYIGSKQITKTYIIGGMGVISSTVQNLVPGAVRIGGNDRYETNTKVMENFKNDLNFSRIYVAIGDGPTGDEFADALSGATLAAREASPVVLTNKTLPSIIENYLKSKVILGAYVIALGGEAAVPRLIIDDIIDLVDKVEVKTTFDKAGTYGPTSGIETVSGNIVISGRDVILQNMIIEGDLLLDKSIGDGNVTLNGITVKGNIIVRGGGPNSVIMYNVSSPIITVDVPDGTSVRLVAEGNTTIGFVTMNSDGKLEESGLTATGFRTVEIAEGVSVTLTGDFDTVNVEGAGANVNIESTRINTLNVTRRAYNSHINITGTSNVTTLEANTPADITGTGSITYANVKSEGVTIAQKPTITTIFVNAITVTGMDNKTAIVNGEKLQMKANVIPANAANMAIDWTVSTLAGGSATIDKNGLLTSTGVGTIRVTATNGYSGVYGTLDITVKKTQATLVAEYVNAKSAAEIETLFGENELGLILTDYDVLDDTGKTEVATALYNSITSLTTKELIQVAVTPAITAAKTALAERIAEAELIKAHTGPTYINGILLVNKKYYYPSNYNFGLQKETSDAFDLMKADAAKAGYRNLYVFSGFRSYDTQARLFRDYCEIDGEEKANMYSARPGQSEHQTGLALDISGVNSDWKWVHANAHKYGFILRYPDGKTGITGYQYEPWHFRYVGVEHATNIYNSGVTLEEYLGV